MMFFSRRFDHLYRSASLGLRVLRVGTVMLLGCGVWAFAPCATAEERGPRPGPRAEHGEPPGPRHGHDHHMARQALEQGRVLPLRSVLEKIEREYQGQVLKIEFEQERGQFFYEIRLLQSDGRMAKLKVDAVDGRVLFIKRREP